MQNAKCKMKGRITARRSLPPSHGLRRTGALAFLRILAAVIDRRYNFQLEQFHENCSRTEADQKASSPRPSPPEEEREELRFGCIIF
jgi:hypothetical protein